VLEKVDILPKTNKRCFLQNILILSGLEKAEKRTAGRREEGQSEEARVACISLKGLECQIFAIHTSGGDNVWLLVMTALLYFISCRPHIGMGINILIG
jgi:hypothetical protein